MSNYFETLKLAMIKDDKTVDEMVDLLSTQEKYNVLRKFCGSEEVIQFLLRNVDMNYSKNGLFINYINNNYKDIEIEGLSFSPLEILRKFDQYKVVLIEFIDSEYVQENYLEIEEVFFSIPSIDALLIELFQEEFDK